MILPLIALFFAGALLCNAVPHFVSGLQGRPFPTPFAKPPGEGDSSPLVNALWGFFNFVIGLGLLLHFPITVNFYPNLAAFLIGVLLLAIFTSRHFGKVQRAKSSQ